MERKNESIYALDDFVKKVGIPEVLLCDNDATMEGWGEWKKRIRKYSIDPKYTEPYSPFQNKAELDIRELKRMIRRFQDKTRSPRRLWNYLVNLCARIRSFVAGTHPDLQGRSAFEQVHGWTPDISLYVMHGWYEVISYLDNDNERKLACWLGPAEDYGGGTQHRREEIAELLESIEEKIGISGQTRRWRKSLVKISFLVDIFGDLNDATEDGGEFRRSDADDYTPEAFDQYLTAEIVTDRGGDILRGTVKSRKEIMTESQLDRQTQILYWIPANTLCVSRTGRRRHTLRI
ncbi:hypothetical protein MHU86_4630 [Fragilaria crotonensis]|nr:hypothetical protein MHU86_4630 [Fragilaria crotonensis]